MSAADELSCALAGRGRVLFTTRSDGNMSSVSGELAHEGTRVREHLRARIGASRIARARQVHGAHVRRLRSAEEAADAAPLGLEADGHATAMRGVAVMVLAADCLPVALGSDAAVAMLHAGWRGLAAGVLEEGVRALREVGGLGPIEAVIGPGAGACCYEVGPEVHDALGERCVERAFIDLREIAAARLRAAGVSHVTQVAACTICDERFFSHRREGERSGRQAGVAWLS
ncbi:MAG: polyphenol oxidase family protein [Actinobacteria bacterium]|nr:MAG: polyphenol oxidase family protein [Actinomycetota bacterium]